MRKGIRNEWLILGGLGILAGLWRRNVHLTSACALASAAVYLAGEEEESFAGQSVLITGASRGLGLALALRFAREGAKVAILARDLDELHRATDRIRAMGGIALPLVCDVTDSHAMASAIRTTAREFGGLDVLVNNAGAITVGPFESMEPKDFEAQVKLHLLAVVEACRLSLPHLRQSAGRRIVNICSMGGRVGVPHMLPYDASKFALSGFSQGLGAELAREDISVTTIYPALMRTGSPMQAVFKGEHEKEFAWFAAADVFPGLSLSAEEAAEKIVAAARRRDTELMPSLPAKARMAAAAFFPETLAAFMGWIGGLMPKGQSLEHRTGNESRALFNQMRLVGPLRERVAEAEKEWNQQPRHSAEFNMGINHSGKLLH